MEKHNARTKIQDKLIRTKYALKHELSCLGKVGLQQCVSMCANGTDNYYTWLKILIISRLMCGLLHDRDAYNIPAVGINLTARESYF